MSSKVNAQSKSEVAASSESSASLKNQSDIDGPQQDSQETDDVYEDTRNVDERLPPAGKNVGELNVNDLSKEGNK